MYISRIAFGIAGVDLDGDHISAVMSVPADRVSFLTPRFQSGVGVVRQWIYESAETDDLEPFGVFEPFIDSLVNRRQTIIDLVEKHGYDCFLSVHIKSSDDQLPILEINSKTSEFIASLNARIIFDIETNLLDTIVGPGVVGPVMALGDPLPLGSVVELRDFPRKRIFVSSVSRDSDGAHYSGWEWPSDYLRNTETFHFRHKDIEHIIHLGYGGDYEGELIENLETWN
jgi:hypothetical protein